MNDQFINIVFPPLFLLLWGRFCMQNGSNNLRFCALFFTSIACFSQNFSLIFRELHQLIQLGLVFLFVLIICTKQLLLKIFFIPLLFLGFICISLIFSSFDADAKVQLINFCVVFIVLCFLYVSLTNEQSLIKILSFIGELGFLVAISGIVEYLLGLSVRIEGTFANPNYFALFVGIAWAPAYYYFKGQKKYIALLIMVIAIVLSGSRSALIIPFLSILWLIYLQGNIIKTIAYGLAMSLLIFGVYLSGVTRFSSSETTGSDEERLIFTKIAVDMAIEHPLSGVGWGRFVPEFANYASKMDQMYLAKGSANISKQVRRVTHNDLLRIMAELGFIAVCAVIYFLIKTGYLIFKYRGFGFNCLFPCWAGMLLFSLAHNNLNTAFSWFFLLLPWLIYYQRVAPKLRDDFN
ncbi:MAG: O-antigen ligase [Alteromonadaceae bacterium]|jgi:O-antigen ligase